MYVFMISDLQKVFSKICAFVFKYKHLFVYIRYGESEIEILN